MAARPDAALVLLIQAFPCADSIGTVVAADGADAEGPAASGPSCAGGLCNDDAEDDASIDGLQACEAFLQCGSTNEEVLFISFGKSPR